MKKNMFLRKVPAIGVFEQGPNAACKQTLVMVHDVGDSMFPDRGPLVTKTLRRHRPRFPSTSHNGFEGVPNSIASVVPAASAHSSRVGKWVGKQLH